MRAPREPFFGMPEDADLLPKPAPGALDTAYEKAITAEVTERLEHFGAGCERHMIGGNEPHPDAVEKGISLPLGFMQHRGWLYTSCTRAKKTAVLIGDDSGIRRAAERIDTNKRTTVLQVFAEVEGARPE